MTVRAGPCFSRSLARATLAGVCLASLACGAARRGEPLGTPVALDRQGERGRLVFMAKCQQCHPGGEAGVGPALNDKPLPEFLKKFQVRHGLGTMPSFSEQEISDEQLESLMDYLNALRRSRPIAGRTSSAEIPSPDVRAGGL